MLNAVAYKDAMTFNFIIACPIDDVLYTGRSIRAALTAIQSFGRPSEIELLTLIDRRFSRHLPIQPNYRGRQVDAINEEKVKVMWKENDGKILFI